MTPQKIKTDLADTFWSLVGLGFLGLIVLCIWVILPDSWTDKIRYSVEDSIDMAQVHRADVPTDCDFMHAPLGNKDCHYKKTVTAYNAVNYPVAGDDAPKIC